MPAPVSSMEFESKNRPTWNPDFGKTTTCLDHLEVQRRHVQVEISPR